jgi:hypothetical protein
VGKRKQPLNSTREWVSFEDPDEDRTWVFDVTFLRSSWTCIFGRGCQGVLTGPVPELVQGCCSYGAHFTDDADVKRVKKIATTLTDEQWQFRKQGRARGTTKKGAEGVTVTRLVQDACIFLNRPGFAAGAGCALHLAALQKGDRPLDYKPEVCWQLPLRREDHEEDDGHVTSRIVEWQRRHWGDGGQEFHWWCTEAPEAFVGHEPVYRSMRDELVELVGKRVYARVVDYLDAREAQPVTFLPHPTVRRRPAVP